MRGRGPWQEAQRSSLRYSMGTPLHDLAPQNTPNHSNRCGRSPGGWGPGWGLQHPGKKAWVLLTPEAGTGGRGMWGTKRMEGPRERAGGLILHAHPQGKAMEKVETVAYFIFLGSKITANGGCSHEFKRCLLLGRKLVH